MLSGGTVVREFERTTLTSGVPRYVALLLFGMALSIYAGPLVDNYFLSRLKESFGMDAYLRGKELQQLLSSIEHLGDYDKLIAINRHFNGYRYIDDTVHWGERDYWATPLEFIGRAAGDCEDYVIAKYFALRAAGVAEEKLYLTYVHAIKLDVAHMVLTYFQSPESVPLVLDNYDLRILPATDRSDLLPVYSFNARSFFLTDSAAGVGRILPSGRVKNNKWKDLLHDLQARANE